MDRFGPRLVVLASLRVVVLGLALMLILLDLWVDSARARLAARWAQRLRCAGFRTNQGLVQGCSGPKQDWPVSLRARR